MALTAQEGSRGARGALPWGGLAGPALFALALAAGAAAFWRGLASLVDAWAIPEYSHGPIIPLISLFLFLREMREVPPVETPIRDRWPGVATIALGLAVGVLGELARIPDIVTYGFIIWCAGMVLACFGYRRGRLFWPAILHLVFMLPLPQFVYWQVSIYLQTVSSQIGVGLISLAGIPVYLDGNVIDLGVYKLQVAEACSGLRYLFPMLSFSYVFAVLYQGPMWHKAVLLLSAAPITVAMNSFRIGMIGVLVNSYGIEHAEGFLHTFEGWIIFVACVCILFMEATLLQQLTAAPKRLSETLDIEFEGLGAQLMRARSVVPSAALAAGGALTLAVALSSALLPERTQTAPPREPLVLFTKTLGDWRGTTQLLEPNIEAVLAADDYFSASYVSPSSRAPVDFFVAYYEDQTDGSGIHSPQVCIPAGGWEVSRWSRVDIDVAPGIAVTANRALIQKGLEQQVVYYWFEQRGERIINDYVAKVKTIVSAMAEGRSDGALVRLVTPIVPGEPQGAADERLRLFLAEAMPALPRFVPH